MKEKDYKIAAEPAQEQLELLLDFYDIEVPGDGELDDVQKAAKTSIKKLKRYIRMGLVEITEADGLTVIQHLKHSKGDTKTITYGVCDGKAKMAMAKAGEKDHSGKIYQLMGSLSNLSADSLSRLIAVDSNVVECLGAVFLTA